MEHRPAAETRKAVAVDVDDVDVAGAQRDAFLEDLRAFIDQRVNATLEDFLVADLAALDARLLRGFDDKVFDDGIRNRIAVARFVTIPAGTRFLAEAAKFAHLVRHPGITQVRWPRCSLALADVPAHVEPRQVADPERTHGEAEILDDLVHLLRQSAFLEQEPRFAEITVQHAVADETVAHAGDDADFLDRLRQLQRRGEHVLAGLVGPHDFQQLHYVRRTEEMQPEYVLRTRGRRGNLVHIERGSVGGDDGARLGKLVDLFEHLLLDGHVLEYGLDDDVRILDVLVAGDPGEQGHALVHGFLAEAALGDCGGVVPAHDAQALIQRLPVHFQHLDWNAGIGEIHRDAAAHGARADQCRGFDFAYRRIVGYVRNLADLAFGEEQVPQRARLVRFHQHLELLALERDALGKGQAGRRFYAGSNRQGRRETPPRLGDARACRREESLRRLVRHGIQLTGTAHALAFLEETVGIGDRRGTQVACDNLIHETGLFRLFAGNRIAGHHEIQRLLHAHQSRRALSSAGTRKDAELHFGQRDLGAGQRDPVVAAQGQLQSPAHGRTGNRGDDGLGDRVHVGKRVGQRGLARIVGSAELADIGAAAEVASTADDDEGADMVVVVALLEGLQDALDHALVHRQRVDRRIVERDDAYAALLLKID